MNSINRILSLTLILTSLIGCDPNQQVDVIIHNAKIYTVDETFSIAEAMAIKDGKIVEIGPEHTILNKFMATEKLDMNKQVILPGLIDAHSHFLGYGLTLNQVNLVGTKSLEAVYEIMKAYATENNDDWIIGRGWDQNDWDEKSFPTNSDLDSIFPSKYVAIKRIDGHAILVSKNVLALAGITSESKVAGGEILLDRNGEPTGVLVDEAMSLIDSVIPEVTPESKAQALLKAQENCIQVGLTTVTDAGLTIEEVSQIDALHTNGQLSIRVYAMYSASKEILNGSRSVSLKTERLTAKAIKVYGDGALGSRGAHLLSPYSDDSTSVGFMITPEDSLHMWAKFCKSNNLQLAVHCIGSAGNRKTLNAMAAVLNGTNDLRWRIEHAQMIHPDDHHLFRDNNIIPSMQPTHVTSDMYWVEERVGGERKEWTYSTHSLMEQNGLIALGTDFPVEGIEPLHTYYAAVTRTDQTGYPEGGFLPGQLISREEALKGMTIWAAIASFEEEQKGSLEPGKFADFVVLDRDILQCAPTEILSTNVLETWINGSLKYEK
ncbi:amidohydrolase [Salibacteraceae bacterium]|nr:amidohydrolase [Salibacteraceae bacterium]